MKKFMIIPAVLLVFGLLVSGCDTGGDWGRTVPQMPEGWVIYDGKSWKQPIKEPLAEGDEVDIEFVTPIDFEGEAYWLLAEFTGDQDLGWWFGANWKGDGNVGPDWVDDSSPLVSFIGKNIVILDTSDCPDLIKFKIAGGGPSGNLGIEHFKVITLLDAAEMAALIPLLPPEDIMSGFYDWESMLE